MQLVEEGYLLVFNLCCIITRSNIKLQHQLFQLAGVCLRARLRGNGKCATIDGWYNRIQEIRSEYFQEGFVFYLNIMQ
ncbi:hypothetical protein D9M68_819980 [compost metagenome]